MASTTTTNPTATETEAEEQVGDEEDDEDVITGVSRPVKRIVLTKQTLLLASFVIVTVLAIMATVYTLVFHLDEYDYPPTESSEESLRNTLSALITLAVVTPIGFVILKFRLTNLLIGVLYLFLLVLCLIIPAKGITYGIFSLSTDQINTIQQFAVNPAIEHKLHNFWAAYQKLYSCCGTLEIDKVEDWSYFLNTTDFPATCCTPEQKQYAKSLALSDFNQNDNNPTAKYKPELDPKTSYCGRGLARTRNKGLGIDKTTLFKRPFSGFFLSLSKVQISKMFSKFHERFGFTFNYQPNNTLVDQLDFRSKKIETVGAVDAFMNNWKTFYLDSVCNTVDDLIDADPYFQPNSSDQACTFKNGEHPNDIAYPANMSFGPLKSIGIIGNITEAVEVCMKEGWVLEVTKTGEDPTNDTEARIFCEKQIPRLRLNATTIGRELLQRLDYLTTYIYEFSPEGPKKVHEGTWVLWEIPTRFDPSEIYPFKLNANYLRSTNNFNSVKDHDKAKKMYYFSRGIAENLVLQSVVYSQSCELLDESHRPAVKSKLARDLNKRWRKSKPFSNWKNSEEGLGHFFLHQLQKLMFITIIVSSCNIICVIILAVVFWQYYSRIKAEEYANLALPKEFEVLHLRRGSLIDERDIVKDTVRFRKRRVGPGGRGGPQQQRKFQRQQRGPVPSGGTGRVQPPGPLPTGGRVQPPGPPPRR